jgi:glycosyltransferase involved in cell wall biosynthesis
MKILFCNKYNFRFSGTEAYLFDLMQMLRAEGHSVALFSMADPRGEPTPHDQFFVSHIDFKAGPQKPWQRVRRAAHAIYSREARKKVAQLLQEFRPDVAHVRNIYHHLSPSILWELKKQGVPVVYHLNDFKLLCPNYNFVARGAICERCRGGRYRNAVVSNCYPGGRLAGTVLALEAYLHRWLETYQTCVDCFLVPRAFVRDKLIEYGWPAGRIQVLPHFQKVREEEVPSPRPGAPVLYFGRLSAEKGLTDLLAAAERAPQVPLVLAGDGPQRAELEQRCVSANLCMCVFSARLRARNSSSRSGKAPSPFFRRARMRHSAKASWSRMRGNAR